MFACDAAADAVLTGKIMNMMDMIMMVAMTKKIIIIQYEDGGGGGGGNGKW